MSKKIKKTIKCIVHGNAGTGKSFLIAALKQILGEKVKLAATTGVASYNIKGLTIHRTVRLPGNTFEGKPLNYGALDDLQKEFKGVEWLIIDKMSMLDQRQLHWVNERLKQIKAKTQNFGGMNIILIGDFYQLPPVKAHPIFCERKHVLKQSNKNKHGLKAFKSISHAVILETVQRQKGSSYKKQLFRRVLRNVRKGVATEQDYRYLESRKEMILRNENGENLGMTPQKLKEIVRMLPTNEQCAEENTDYLLTLNKKICRIQAFHRNKRDRSVLATDLSGLEAISYYAVNAKVMLRTNLCTSFGLVNGSVGHIKDIIFHENQGPPSLPKAVIVDFPGYSGPPLMCSGDESHPSYDKEKLTWVPIVPFTAKNFVNGKFRERRQIPLRVAHAITIHKSQGLTLDSAWIDVGTTHRFGLIFVALSRVRDIDDLVIKGFSYPRYEKIAEKYKREEGMLNQVKKAMKFVAKKAAKTNKELSSISL